VLKFFLGQPLQAADAGVSRPGKTKEDAVKINDTLKSNQGLPTGGTPASGAKGADKAVAAPTSAPTDTVRLSSQGQALAGAVGSAAVFDTKKVERIKSAIADGQFSVNSEKVADSLLETVRDLLHSRKR
jgi:negative regulator of flagellin synthesis FlgM